MSEYSAITSYHHMPEICVYGARKPRDHWDMYNLPYRVDGQQVLDIGCWTGGFAIEAVKRGAAHVYGVDVFGQLGNIPLGTTRTVIQRSGLEDHIDLRYHDITMSPCRGIYDTVLFLQVLYHLLNPFAGLCNALQSAKRGGQVYVETLCSDRPEALIIPWFKENSLDFTIPTVLWMELAFRKIGVHSQIIWSDDKKGIVRKCWRCDVVEPLRYTANQLTQEAYDSARSEQQ